MAVACGGGVKFSGGVKFVGDVSREATARDSLGLRVPGWKRSTTNRVAKRRHASAHSSRAPIPAAPGGYRRWNVNAVPCRRFATHQTRTRFPPGTEVPGCYLSSLRDYEATSQEAGTMDISTGGSSTSCRINRRSISTERRLEHGISPLLPTSCSADRSQRKLCRTAAESSATTSLTVGTTSPWSFMVDACDLGLQLAADSWC